MKKKSIIPNMLSILRMLGTLALVFVQPVTLPFFVIYTLCGVSDVLDGWIARATDSTSELGSRLDSAADLMFYVVMMLRILPELVAYFRENGYEFVNIASNLIDEGGFLPKEYCSDNYVHQTYSAYAV